MYHTVSIVLGAVVTKEELMNYATYNEEESRFQKGSIGKVPCGRVCIHSLPGHEEEAENTFVIGFDLHTYYRYHNTGCEKCEKYTCCDTCIGQTSNGFYDVVKMQEEIIEVNLRHVCLHCYADNRFDLGMGTIEWVHNKLKCCKTCGKYPAYPEKSPEDALARDYHVEQLRKFIDKREVIKGRHIGFYYIMGGCMCCT
jgi:hypothetical protein